MQEINFTKDSSGIVFNSVKQADNFKITDYPRYYKNNFTYVEQGLQTITPIYNAIEIDWNGAQLILPQILGGNRTINTTGDLLKERIQHNSPMFARVA